MAITNPFGARTLLTVAEVAWMTDQNKCTIRRWINTGLLTRLGVGRLYVDFNELAKLLENPPERFGKVGVKRATTKKKAKKKPKLTWAEMTKEELKQKERERSAKVRREMDSQIASLKAECKALKSTIQPSIGLRGGKDPLPAQTAGDGPLPVGQ